MNERIKELRKQVSVDMHLHNLEDFRAMSGCFGLEGGNKIVDDYLEKFAELIVKECMTLMNNERDYYAKTGSYEPESYYIRCATKVDAFDDAARLIKHHFGVEE